MLHTSAIHKCGDLLPKSTSWTCYRSAPFVVSCQSEIAQPHHLPVSIHPDPSLQSIWETCSDCLLMTFPYQHSFNSIHWCWLFLCVVGGEGWRGWGGRGAGGRELKFSFTSDLNNPVGSWQFSPFPFFTKSKPLIGNSVKDKMHALTGQRALS